MSQAKIEVIITDDGNLTVNSECESHIQAIGLLEAGQNILNMKIFSGAEAQIEENG